MSQTINEAVKSKYGAVARQRVVESIRGAASRGVRLYSGGARVDSGGSEHGALMRQPDGDRESRPGEVVVDLGCGGGLDVFLASAKVGPTGKRSAST